MSNLIVDPNDKQVNPAHDRFLDSAATRRELQQVIDHFAKHLDNLYATLDTQHIVLNFMAEEKLNVTQAELLAYVAKKRQEMEDKKNKLERTCKHGKTEKQECSECCGGFDGASPQITETVNEQPNG